MRLRALAATALIAVILLTALPGEAVLAGAPAPASTAVATTVDPSPSPVLLAPASDGTEFLPSRTASTPPPVVAVAAKPAAPAKVPAAAVVIAFARSHLRAPYRLDSTGPGAFDCSGLMWRVFHEAGLGSKVRGTSARAIYLAYRRLGLASRHDPQVGDLVIWGNGSHVGVYIGGGRAISALITGVRVHRVHAMFTPFTAYLHTRLAGIVRPVWELELARHVHTVRHATRTVALRAAPGSGASAVGRIHAGGRFVVLARHRVHSRTWLRVLTFGGRSGWVPKSATAR
jgi:peptidoglycan DL-endopeptidase CwlO